MKLALSQKKVKTIDDLFFEYTPWYLVTCHTLMYNKMLTPLFVNLGINDMFSKTTKCMIWYFMILVPLFFLFAAYLGMAILSLIMPG